VPFVADSFHLSTERTHKVTLGCGTLILIALIVMLFSNAGSRGTGQELENLANKVNELKRSVDAQTEQIRRIEELLKKRDAGAKVEQPEGKR
jgi:hypothetical protein